MDYKCQGCDLQLDGNPARCPNCGNTIFTPVEDKGGKAKVEIDTDNGIISKVRDLFKG